MMETSRRHEDHEHRGPAASGRDSGGRGDAGGDALKDASFSPEMRHIADQHLEAQAARGDAHAGSKPENPAAELKPEPHHAKE